MEVYNSKDNGKHVLYISGDCLVLTNVIYLEIAALQGKILSIIFDTQK